MKISKECLEAIKRFEGFRAEAYICPGGKWTIGYGHTKGVKSGQKITERAAEVLLEGDLLTYEKFVDDLGLRLNQNQFDALVDFAFNLGVGALAGSTLLRKIRLNKQDPEITGEFQRWTKAGGKVQPGLVNRRQWEADHYFKS